MLTVKQTINWMVEAPYKSDEQSELFKSSWSINEGFKNLQGKLDELVPFSGRVEHSKSKNKSLERYRVASNLVYDLFNNGLMNRRSHFRGFFGWSPSTAGGISQAQFEYANTKLEPVMTRIMIDAGKEQGVI